ncbi:MAG: hypothetical protein ACK53Y_18075, partial [bacterium]
VDESEKQDGEYVEKLGLRTEDVEKVFDYQFRNEMVDGDGMVETTKVVEVAKVDVEVESDDNIVTLTPATATTLPIKPKKSKVVKLVGEEGIADEVVNVKRMKRFVRAPEWLNSVRDMEVLTGKVMKVGMWNDIIAVNESEKQDGEYVEKLGLRTEDVEKVFDYQFRNEMVDGDGTVETTKAVEVAKVDVEADSDDDIVTPT